MLALLILAVVLVALVAGTALVLPRLDRRCAALAEEKAAEFLSAPFGHPVTVRVNGRPFLTQAVRGRYADVEVSGGLRIGEISGATLVAHLSNAYLPLRDLLGRRASELPCERVRGQLLLPYRELARVTRIPGLKLRYYRGRLLAAAALPVPGISQLVQVNGDAVLSLGPGGGSVWLRLHGVTVVGITLPSVVMSQLLPTLTVPVPLPPLPYGLRFDAVRPTAAGLEVDGAAEAVVLRPILRDADLDQ